MDANRNPNIPVASRDQLETVLQQEVPNLKVAIFLSKRDDDTMFFDTYVPVGAHIAIGEIINGLAYLSEDLLQQALQTPEPPKTS